MPYKPPKAYKNMQFLNSRDARPLRILAEYIEPESRFRKARIRDTIVFFGSARTLDRERASAQLASAQKAAEGSGAASDLLALKQAQKQLEMAGYYEDARTLAKMLTEWSISLDDKRPPYYISSGGGPGIMEAANRGASEAQNGKSIGLNISLPMEQYPNEYITKALNFEFHYFFTRKFWFLNLARALVVFPGGFGTMDELFEALTLIQTRKLSRKLPIIIYGESFWRSLVNFDTLVENMVISPEDLDLFKFCDTPEAAFEILTSQLDRHLKKRKRWY